MLTFPAGHQSNYDVMSPHCTLSQQRRKNAFHHVPLLTHFPTRPDNSCSRLQQDIRVTMTWCLLTAHCLSNGGRMLFIMCPCSNTSPLICSTHWKLELRLPQTGSIAAAFGSRRAPTAEPHLRQKCASFQSFVLWKFQVLGTPGI